MNLSRSLRIGATLAVVYIGLACASLSVKERTVRQLQSVDAAITAVDTLERQACQPAPVPKQNICTATPRLLSDADHQRMSGWIIAASTVEKQAAVTMAAWDPATPKPTNLPSGRIYIQQAHSLVETWPAGETRDKFLVALDAVLTALDLVGGSK